MYIRFISFTQWIDKNAKTYKRFWVQTMHNPKNLYNYLFSPINNLFYFYKLILINLYLGYPVYGMIFLFKKRFYQKWIYYHLEKCSMFHYLFLYTKKRSFEYSYCIIISAFKIWLHYMKLCINSSKSTLDLRKRKIYLRK